MTAPSASIARADAHDTSRLARARSEKVTKLQSIDRAMYSAITRFIECSLRPSRQSLQRPDTLQRNAGQRRSRSQDLLVESRVERWRAGPATVDRLRETITRRPVDVT